MIVGIIKLIAICPGTHNWTSTPVLDSNLGSVAVKSKKSPALLPTRVLDPGCQIETTSVGAFGHPVTTD